MLTESIPAWWTALTADQQSLGRLDEAAPNRWRVPNDIAADAGRIHYGTGAFTVLGVPGIPAPYKVAKNPGARLLADFVVLGDADDTEIGKFAKKWGVLGVCTHGFPPTSCPGARYLEEMHGLFCKPRGYPFRCSEPTSVWRAIANWTRALLNAVSMLRREDAIALQDWSVLAASGKLTGVVPADVKLQDQWKFVALRLNAWLEMISFRPGLQITPDARPEFRLTVSQHEFSQFLAVIVLELLFQVTRAGRLLTCSSCGQPYIPKRLPTRGQKRYCPKCGIRAAQRDAAARWRKNNPDYFRKRRSRKPTSSASREK